MCACCSLLRILTGRDERGLRDFWVLSCIMRNSWAHCASPHRYQDLARRFCYCSSTHPLRCKEWYVLLCFGLYYLMGMHYLEKEHGPQRPHIGQAINFQASLIAFACRHKLADKGKSYKRLLRATSNFARDSDKQQSKLRHKFQASCTLVLVLGTTKGSTVFRSGASAIILLINDEVDAIPSSGCISTSCRKIVCSQRSWDN